MSNLHNIEQELANMRSVRMSQTQRQRIWQNIEADMRSTRKRAFVNTRGRWASIAGLAAAIALVAGGYGIQEKSQASRTVVNSPAKAIPAISDILYHLTDYAVQANQLTVPFYEDGNVIRERIPEQQSLAAAKAHSPWRTDPVQSAQVYTGNLLPAGFAHTGWTTTKHDALTTSLNGVIVSYQLLSRNDSVSPPIAKVRLSITGEGHASYYLISLFELQHRYVWDIAQIARSAAPPVALPTRIKSLSIASGPAGAGYDPNDLHAVSRQVTAWLQQATRTTWELPTPSPNLVFNAYVGPDMLFFTAADNTPISITPAYTIIKTKSGYQIQTQRDTIEYRTPTEVAYLHCPALYKWLDDHAWRLSFHIA
ncbi:hypothetical protein C7445_101197 [Alicyclobacillus sacchari]|uniref:Uncharacterized protein n=2 Tax=Alicyclobacillus sacchari TaxID=392010 RepID=A0A4R8LWL5_9BACL|nr:hypothetical protein C7445_101197 [Alicyclobacillus sacchari]